MCYNLVTICYEFSLAKLLLFFKKNIHIRGDNNAAGNSSRCEEEKGKSRFFRVL